MLSAKEFMDRVKLDQEMLARNECPPGWKRCPKCECPRQGHHFVGLICDGCDNQAKEDALGEEMERYPILHPRYMRNAR